MSAGADGTEGAGRGAGAGGSADRTPDTARPRWSGAGLYAGRLFGVPVFVAPSWFLVAAFLTVLYAPTVRSRAPGVSHTGSYFVAFIFAVVLYLSVLLHELGHSLVAKGFGLPVRRITIQALVGLSEIEREPETPAREFLVALAGPAVSLALAGVGFLLAQPLPDRGVLQLLALVMFYSNGIVSVVNLLPGLPLDGGRLLSAVVWRVTGRKLTGLTVAGWAGRVVAIGIVAWPLVRAWSAAGDPGATDTRGTGYNLAISVLIAMFVWAGATAALRSAKVREVLPSVRVASLARRALAVPADLPLAEALRRAELDGARGLVVVGPDGRPTAIVSEAAVSATPVQRRPWVSVGTLARATAPERTLTLDQDGELLLGAMRAAPASEYLVLDPNGEVSGVIATADVAAVMTAAVSGAHRGRADSAGRR